MKTKDKMIGAGLGLAALAAAGTYFLYGKRGVNNRKMINGWVLQLKGQVLEKLEKVKKVEEVNKAAYDALIEETVSRFGRVKKISTADLKLITADLKNAWSHIEKQLA